MTRDGKNGLKNIPIRLSFTWLEWLDRLVAMNVYSSRAEAIRGALADYLGEIESYSQDVTGVETPSTFNHFQGGKV
ncbi:MAG: ribbon-helix-helix domain-containing protein [Candidatus Odinarchaeota archaeon]